MRHNWQVISGIALFLGVFEIFEIVQKGEPLIDFFHSIELAIYLLILTLVGVLINFLIKSNAAQNHTMKILNFKHNVSMELTKMENWEILTSELARLPSTLASVEASRLLVYSPIGSQWEAAACWSRKGAETTVFSYDCQKCLKERNGTEFIFSPCQHTLIEPNEAVQSREYCLPINYANSLLGVIQFRLVPGESLSGIQNEIFESIRYEVALALKVSQEQKRLSEMRLTEMALAERHSFTTYLHDNLSQNLAYLCLKLDQFIAGEEQILAENGQSELRRMKDAANQSYDMVRGMIETTYPETTPHFVNLIVTYAKKVSLRANIEISIDRIGVELPVSPEIQQEVIYVFQEVLSNVEKHARAKKAKVLIIWGEDSLVVTVSDDGVGFNPDSVDHTKHFGMDIIQERIGKIQGRIDIHSSANAGTEITISVPILLSQTGEL